MNTRKRIQVIAIWAVMALLTAGAVAATIGSLTSLPDVGPIITPLDRANINANAVTTNTNFTNVNAALGVATGTPTGTGAIVLANTPTLITPVLGVATATSINGSTIASSTAIIGSSFSDCATTAACPSTAKSTYHIVQGIGLLATGSPSTYAVTTISPAFTSATSYNCFAQDASTIATNIGVLTAGYVSGSAVTFTGPNTNTDTFRWTCAGY